MNMHQEGDERGRWGNLNPKPYPKLRRATNEGAGARSIASVRFVPLIASYERSCPLTLPIRRFRSGLGYRV